MKKQPFTTLTLLALFVALPPVALASTTWYVDGVNGNDGNTCQTPQTACKTIGHAISLASSGDSIVVAPATYTERLGIAISLNVIGSGARTTIIDGQAAGSVIGISSPAQVTLSNITVRNGHASFGAGIYNEGRLTINSSTVTGNNANFFGSIISCCAYGGGIYNGTNGTLTINNSTISANTAGGGGWHCGLLPCQGSGGGIANVGQLRINNSTISGNSAFGLPASTNGRGGGIFNGYPGGMMVSNSTISGNSGTHGGGIYPGGGFQNSIVANNSGQNCSNPVTSDGYNLSSDGTCNFNKVGDLNNHAPLLGPLQNNGGPTDTMALLLGSPAIDAGNPAGCKDAQGNLLLTDQRGMPRPDKEDASGCDMGAYESQGDAGIGPLQVAVPNVVGETQAAATTAIMGAGLVVGTVTQQSSSTVASGDVISESPAAGTNVATGSAVNLVVSTGPVPPSAPSLLAPSSLSFGNVLAGTISAPQSAMLTNVGNTPLKILSMTYNDNAPGGFWDVLYTTTCAPNLTIAPGSSCAFSIAFEANSNASGPQPGSVIMNFAAGGSATLQLSANVIP